MKQAFDLTDRRAIVAAALAAVGLPIILLAAAQPAMPPATPLPVVKREPAPPPRPALGRVYARALFAPDLSVADLAVPDDAPVLIGVIGRIDRDAVALVRGEGGAGTRTLAIGDSTNGWRLVSLTIDAGYFERGGRRVRVPLPTDDAAGQ